MGRVSDSDCVFGVCVDYGTYRSCFFLPIEDTDGQVKLVECLKEQINVFLLLFIQTDLGATDDNFDEKLFDAVTGGTCSGAPLDSKTRSDIQDERTCEQKQYCNWAVCPIDEDCTIEECSDFTHLGSTNYCTFCLESADGSACPEVSQFGTCVVTEPAYNTYYGLCDFYGYSWNSLSNTPCSDATATTKETCNPPEYCTNADKCPGQCIYPHLDTDVGCRSQTVNGLFLTWITWVRDGTTRGLCVLEGADALTCPRNFGLWRPGTEWAPPLYSTKSSCEAAGQCSDLTITDKARCETAGFCDICPTCKNPTECNNAGLCNNHVGCVKSYNSNGRCLEGSWTPMGCLFPELSRLDCQTTGGKWVESFTKESECLSWSLCQSADVPDFDITEINSDLLGLTDIPLGWNNKSKTVCESEACSDKWTSVYAFKKGVWSPRVWKSFTWESRKILNYQWINTFQEEEFTQIIDESRDQYLATIKTTELLCKYGEEKELVTRLSCDCASETDCSALLDQVQFTSTGVYRHCENIVSESKFTGGTLSNGEDFVVVGDLQCVSIKTELVPYAQFLSQSSSTIGNVIISGPQTVRDQVIYYKNGNDIVVGKILDDGVGLVYTSNTTTTIGDAVKGLQFCLELPSLAEDDILTFTYLDLALANADFTDFEVLNLKLPLDVAQACINYPGGDKVYFPIGLTEEYEDAVYYDTWKTSELVVDYIGLALYSILLIACVYLLWGHYIVLQHGNRAITVKRVFNLTRLVLIVVALFLIIRIIFFALVPQGILESDPAVNVILAQLPPLIFLSAYILMLMKWAVMYINLKQDKIQRNSSDDKPVKIGLLVSVVLWLVFIIIIILLFTVPGDAKKFTCVTPQSERDALTDESIISIAYNSFYAFICYICAALFLFMGHAFWVKLDSDKSEGASAAATKRKAVSKLLLVMLGCSMILVIQATILIVQAAGVAFSALDRLIVIICVEVPPTITFFIMCSPNSAISKAKKNDFKEKTQNSRGSIILQKFTPSKKSKADGSSRSKAGDKGKGKGKGAIDNNGPALAKPPPKNIDDEPITIAMVPKARVNKPVADNPFISPRGTDAPAAGGLKLVPRDTKPTDGQPSTGPVLKLKTPDGTDSGFRPQSARTGPTLLSPPTTTTGPVVSPRVDLTTSSTATPTITTIPGTGVKLVHGTTSSPSTGLKFVPRDPASSPAVNRKKDPLDDKLGPVSLKMVPRGGQ